MDDIKQAQKAVEGVLNEAARGFTAILNKTLQELEVKNNNLAHANDQLRRELFSATQGANELEEKLQAAKMAIQELRQHESDESALHLANERIRHLEGQVAYHCKITKDAHAALNDCLSSVTAAQKENLQLAIENDDFKEELALCKAEYDTMWAGYEKIISERDAIISEYKIKLEQESVLQADSLQKQDSPGAPSCDIAVNEALAVDNDPHSAARFKQELLLLQERYDELLAAKEKLTAKYSADVARWRKFKEWFVATDGTPLKRGMIKRKKLFDNLGPHVSPAAEGPSSTTKQAPPSDPPTDPTLSSSARPNPIAAINRGDMPGDNVQPAGIFTSTTQDSATQEESGTPWLPQHRSSPIPSTPAKTASLIVIEDTPPPLRKCAPQRSSPGPSTQPTIDMPVGSPPRNEITGVRPTHSYAPQDLSNHHSKQSETPRRHVPRNTIVMTVPDKTRDQNGYVDIASGSPGKPSNQLIGSQTRSHSCPPDSPHLTQPKQSDKVLGKRKESGDCDEGALDCLEHPGSKRRKQIFKTREEQLEHLRTLQKKPHAEYVAEYPSYKGRGRYAPTSATKPGEEDINALFEINPERNHGLTHQFHEVIRNKAERRKLDAGDCECCRDYYEAIGPMPPRLQPPLWRSPSSSQTDPPLARTCRKQLAQLHHDAEVEAHKKNISRHRHQWAPTSTPPGYWNIGFPDTQQVEDINDRALEMHSKKRQLIERETNKKNGKFRKR